LIWHFLMKGQGEEFQGGEYYGTINFHNFPDNPPEIKIKTPNGRFLVDEPVQIFYQDDILIWNPKAIMSCHSIITRFKKIFFNINTKVKNQPPFDTTQMKQLALYSSHVNIAFPSYVKLFQENIGSNNIIIIDNSVKDSNNNTINNTINSTSPNNLSSIQIENLGSSLDNSQEGESILSREITKDDFKIYNFDMQNLDSDAVRNQIQEAIQEVLQLTLSLMKNTPKIEPNVTRYPMVKILPNNVTIGQEGLPTLKLSYDFSNWDYLKIGYWPNYTQQQKEIFREFTKSLVVIIIDKITEMGFVNGLCFYFSECNLSKTDSSMRCVFNGSRFGVPLHRESQIEVLNLSHTHTTPRSLLSLYRLINLHTLNLDNCSSLQKQDKTIFNLLTKKDPIQSLKRLSIVGTSSSLSHKWFNQIESACPQLTEVYFTRKKKLK